MLRFMGGRAASAVRNSITPRNTPVITQIFHASDDTAEELEARFDRTYVNYLNRPNINHWEIRQVMTNLTGMDLVPDPMIICAALRACRRLNDFALSVRILETVQEKCGPKRDEIWPYILQEIRPTLDELGINTPEELGYDKPELALQSVYDIH